MKDIVFLYGKNSTEDKVSIEASYKKKPIYLLDNPQIKLYQYIDWLHDELEIPNKILHHLRMCQELHFEGNVSLINHTDGVSSDESVIHPKTMSILLQHLHQDTNYSLIIENDNRTLLANIMQQLIYIDYPITYIDVKLRKEYKDAEKTQRFMRRIEDLDRAVASAVEQLTELCTNIPEHEEEHLYRVRAEALTAYKKIQEQVIEAQKVEMKVAVAASKKTGKSVIVNCMIGEELAPTSLELATPNCCIYKRSADAQFHLNYNNVIESFDHAEDIYKHINKQFKQAQNDREQNYAIADMEISYVSNGNNFENYTIYDTPGPDAAGTSHGESAQKAIDECDVAIFAIDYSKYLTDSEEKYLNQVKSLFTAKNKFHTLLFVINKMDLALQDKGTKSRVKSIDFIRNRLHEIDAQYGDCIVFATSAQDYFYTLELQKAARHHPACAPLIDPACDLYRDIRQVHDQIADEDNEALTDLLSNLDGEVSRIYRQLECNRVNIATLQHFSGIPQLLSYIAYVAKSKAREEIVNSITYTIDEQSRSLQSIIDRIANIEEMLGKSETELKRIDEIIRAYEADVREVLSDKLTKEDMEYASDNGNLRSSTDQYCKKKNTSFPINLHDFLAHTRSVFTVDPTECYSEVQKKLWNNLKAKQKDNIRSLMGQIVGENALKITDEQITEIFRAQIDNTLDDRLKKQQQDIRQLAEGLRGIALGRIKKAEHLTQCYQKQLEKTDCQLTLPTFSTFDVDIPKYHLNFSKFNLRSYQLFQNLGTFYNAIGGIHQFFRDILGWSKGKKEIKIKMYSDKELEKELNSMHEAVCERIEQSNVPEIIKENIGRLNNDVQAVNEALGKSFMRINQDCLEKIQIFISSIDDREQYRDNIDGLNSEKTLIGQIQQASCDFFACWDTIVR